MLLAIEEVVAAALEVVGAEVVISVGLISVACAGMGSGNLAVGGQ